VRNCVKPDGDVERGNWVVDAVEGDPGSWGLNVLGYMAPRRDAASISCFFFISKNERVPASLSVEVQNKAPPIKFQV
jgi:hypothetical protein